jgi:phage terminase large subunit
VAAVNELIKGAVTCSKPRPQFAYIAPFLRQAKAVAWHYLKFYAEPLTAKVNEADNQVDLITGGMVRLFGADNADALRGMYFDGAFLDEFGDFKPSVWGNVIRPALSDRQGWAVFGGTPKGRNEFWEIRELARRNPADWFLLELRADESGILPEGELADVRKQLSEDQFSQEYLCDFAAALPGAYFGRELVLAERQGRICEVALDGAVPVHTAWDIGYRDDTAIWFYQVLRGEIHLIDYHASSGQSIDFYAKLINDKPYKYGKHWLPHDAKAKTLASGGKSVVEQLSASLGGWKSLAIVPNLDVQDGIQAVRLALPRCWFDETRCGAGLEALRQYQREYDEDKKAFKERPRHDWSSHTADAFRMLAVAWREERKPDPQEQGKRLGVGPENQVNLNELWEWQKRLTAEQGRL